MKKTQLSVHDSCIHLFKTASTLGMNIKTWMNNKEYGILVFTILETYAMIRYKVFSLKILRFYQLFPVMLHDKVTGKLSVLYFYEVLVLRCNSNQLEISQFIHISLV